MVNVSPILNSDASAVLDTTYLGPANPGGVPAALRQRMLDAKVAPLDSDQRKAALESITKTLFDQPIHIHVCSDPAVVVGAKNLVGYKNILYSSTVPFGDTRYVGIAK
jgi:hypothetical protein